VKPPSLFAFAVNLCDHRTDIICFGARDYDPYTGRWTARDPVLFAGRQANLYAYVGNNPVDLIDASGTAPVCNWSSSSVLVGGGTGAGSGHSGGFGTGTLAPGECVDADHPLDTPDGPLTDVDTVDFNGNGNVNPPAGWKDLWPNGEKIPGTDSGPLCGLVDNPNPRGPPILPILGGWY
jgi:RHS repeat-associated protein